MSVYDLHFNKDLSFFRQLILGVLSRLNGMSWINQVGNKIEEQKTIPVPFYMSTVGSERYLNDNFLNTIDFDPEYLKAETFYNQIPRGIVELSGINVDSQSITNKYVRTEHVIQELDGTLNTYNSETFFIPLIVSFDVSVYVDSILDQLKATELIFKAFYKALPFNFEYNYVMVPAYLTFPDEIQRESTVEYSFEDKKEFKITFSIEARCNMPVYREEHSSLFGVDESALKSRFFVGNRMNTIINRGFVSPLTTDDANTTNTGKFNSGTEAYNNEIK